MTNTRNNNHTGALKAFEDYCETLPPFWNSQMSGTYAQKFYIEGFDEGFHRAVERERTAKTKTYADGTTATGTAPLPPYSAREQEILYLALEVAQKAWDGNCEYAEIEGLAWNLRNGLRDLFKTVGMPIEPPTT